MPLVWLTSEPRKVRLPSKGPALLSLIKFSSMNHHKKSLFTFLFLALLTLCSSCSNRTSDSRPVITVSIEPLRYVVEQIVGDHYKEVTLMPQGASPETYEPTPRPRMELGSSELLFRTGTLGFEQTRLPQMAKTAPSCTMIDLAKGITPIVDIGHTHGDAASESIDPHVWMSTQNLMRMAENVCEAVSRKDSIHATYYQKRLQAFTSQMDSLDLQMRHLTQRLSSRTFLIYHPALGYLARQYGLKQLSVEHDGKEPSAAYMQQLITLCCAEGVKVVFISREHSGKAAQRIAQEIGAQVVEINPLDYDVKGQMISIANELNAAYGK